MRSPKVLSGSLELAFTRLELIMVLFVCVILGVPVFLSAMHRARERSQRINCTNNLKALGLEYKTWALEHGDNSPMTLAAVHGASLEFAANGGAFRYFLIRSNELANPKVMICPSDVRRATIDFPVDFSNSNLSYFVGLDARETNPQMFLFGDRNLTNGPLPPNRILVLKTNSPVGWTSEMHRYQGNIGLADGSVQQFSSSSLTKAIRDTSVTHRLAIP
jgi:hypothetical protein